MQVVSSSCLLQLAPQASTYSNRLKKANYAKIAKAAIHCSEQQHTGGALAIAMSADVLRRCLNAAASLDCPSYFLRSVSSKFETV
jgi:hypothetical protein